MGKGSKNDRLRLMKLGPGPKVSIWSKPRREETPCLRIFLKAILSKIAGRGI
jgi:hypothetical protein